MTPEKTPPRPSGPSQQGRVQDYALRDVFLCFLVGAVLEEQAGDSDAGERGGTVEQAPLSPLLRAAIDAFDEAGPDAAFEQGLAVIVDGLAKRRLVVRNVEGPRKGDD